MAREVRHVYVKVSSNVGTTLPKATAQSEGLRRSLQGVGTAAGAATTGVRGLASALLTSGIGAAAVAIGSIVALFGKAANTSRNFAAEVSKLGAISGATGQDLKDLERDALRLGSRTEWTASQVVGLQIEFSKLGFTKNEILNVTEATLSLASATGVELAEAASISGNMLRAFGLDAGQTQRVADVLTKTVVTSATSMDTLRESMKMVAPTAKNLKVSLEETAAMVALLGDRGIKGTMAGTALRKIFMELAKATGKDVPTSLKMVSEQLANATSDTEKLKIATDLVGVRFAAQLQLLAENTEAIDNYKIALENSTGTAQEIAEKRLDNLNGDLIKLSSAWEGLMLTISESDGPIQNVLRSITQFFTQFVQNAQLRLNIMSYDWDFMWENMSMTLLNAKETFKYNFKLILKRIELFALNAKTALADVPLIGTAIDKEQLSADREQLFAEIMNIEGMLSTTNKRKMALQSKYAEGLAQIYLDFNGELARQATEAASQVLEGFVEGDETVDEAGETAMAKAAAYLMKILKMEQDFQDKSKKEKLIRERDRLIAEMDELKLTETQKGELKLRIAELYAQKIAQVESDEFAKNIDEYDKYIEDKKKREEEYHKTKVQLQYQALDSMSQVFGEETAMAKAVHLLKTGLMIQEMILSAKKQMAEAAGDQAEVVQDGVGANTKALKTLNPLIIAATAISVGAAIVSGVKAMRKRKEAASKLASTAGGSVSGGQSAAPSAPDFNIIGQLSAGESLIASTVAEANAKPVKAYVVEGEIESVRQANATAKKVASV